MASAPASWRRVILSRTRELFAGAHRLYPWIGLFVFIEACFFAVLSHQPPRRLWWLNAFYVYGLDGEALRHRFPFLCDLYKGVRDYYPVFSHMPEASIATALAFCHSNLPAAFWFDAVYACSLLLLAALAGLLEFSGASMLALSATAFAASGAFATLRWDEWDRFSFTPLVFLTTFVVLWRSQNPTKSRALITAAVIGISLAYRPVFVFLPPLLVAMDWRLKPAPKRAAWPRDALVLLLVAYLPLLLWSLVSAVLRERWLWSGPWQSDSNIITGALGMVGTVEGDASALIPAQGKGPVLLWAVGQVLSHPWRYLVGYLERLGFVAGRHPLLAFAAALGLWRHRAIAEYRLLALVICYFVAVYCAMTVMEPYFYPLWPLLALAGSSLLTIEPRGARRLLRVSPLRRLALAMAAVGGVMAALFAAFCLEKVLAYAQAPSSDVAEARALKRQIHESPDDAWLWVEKGLLALKAQDASGAARCYARALRLRYFPSVDLELGFSQLLLGKPRRLLHWKPPPEALEGGAVPGIRVNAGILQAFAYWSLGRPRDSRRRLVSTVDEYCRPGTSILIRGAVLKEREALAALQRACIERLRTFDPAASLIRLAPPRLRADAFLDLFNDAAGSRRRAAATGKARRASE